MSFPRYPAYKPSSVEWLGEVPEHWSIIRLKNVLQCRITDGPHTTPEFIDEGVPFLSVDGIQDGELRFDGCRFISEIDHEEFSRKAQPVRDDILIGKAASTGKIARVKTDFTFSIWSPLALIRVDSQLSSPSFYEQALKSASSQAQIDVLCTSNTQKNISMDDIPRLFMTGPPLEEQLSIATFLNHETAKIDALIAEQQRLIELLQEKRQAVISHAVTMGLNPDAPMKDSGVEWLGEVPEHWDVCKFQRFVQIAEGQVDPKQSPFADMPLIAPNHIQSGTGQLLDLETASQQGAESGKYICNEGDVIYSKIRPSLRKACIAPCACLTSADMYPLRAHGRLSNEFLFRFLLSEPFSALAIVESERVAMPKINRDSLKSVALAIPPKSEQEDICLFIRVHSSTFDALIVEAQEAIVLLSERRSALISAAVTGQIDVRGLVPEAVAA